MAILSNESLVDPLDQALAEREKLIELCMYAFDRTRSTGITERLTEGMSTVGVTALRPDGERFDPTRHEAGGTIATGDHSLDGVIAETEVVGFADRGRMLRAPVVVVYRLNTEKSGAESMSSGESTAS
ncbi:nucleotide exchange factor GrpE [Actinopolyspora sp. H202]|uniref:nucleotide exchange factor GrpE n=1 Tax=Actinopolyspora sp. H202 TaxID=1500456 RepID=UPI003EE6BAA4